MGIPPGDAQRKGPVRPAAPRVTPEPGAAEGRDPVRLRIDPKTYALEGAQDRVFTTEEWTIIEHPRCLVCGRAVHLKAGVVGGHAGWTISGWVCPAGCDPRRSRTGSRP